MNDDNCEWDVKAIVTSWLKDHGYDGLYDYEGDGCACVLNDLMPCNESCDRCLPGVRMKPGKGQDKSADFYIVPRREAKP